MEYKKWTPEEVCLITEQYGKMSDQYLAECLGVSVHSLSAKASRLGIRRSSRWSSEEDELLVQYYRDLPPSEIAHRLGRSENAVFHRARALGVTYKWSSEEDDYIRNHYGKQPSDVIASRLGRTIGAVRERAGRLGIRPPRLAYQAPFIDGDSLVIPLHSRKNPGLIAYTDVLDKDLICQYRWRPHVTKWGTYAVAYDPKSYPKDSTTKTYILMHNLIMGMKSVDHKDHNGLNNRRSNLRPCTASQNAGNQRRRSRETAQYKGVGFDKKNKKWIARIGDSSSHSKHLGVFNDEEDAARAYDRAALEKWGEFACTNFPRCEYDDSKHSGSDVSQYPDGENLR